MITKKKIRNTFIILRMKTFQSEKVKTIFTSKSFKFFHVKFDADQGVVTRPRLTDNTGPNKCFIHLSLLSKKDNLEKGKIK